MSAGSARAHVRTRTDAAPPRSNALAQASAVAPVVLTSSTRITGLPAIHGFALPATRTAPRTLAKRRARDKPPPLRVDRTRTRAKSEARTAGEEGFRQWRTSWRPLHP